MAPLRVCRHLPARRSGPSRYHTGDRLGTPHLSPEPPRTLPDQGLSGRVRGGSTNETPTRFSVPLTPILLPNPPPDLQSEYRERDREKLEHVSQSQRPSVL